MAISDAFLRMHESGLLHVFAFAGGASVGSFLNVFIHRWPRGESLIRPGSHCPACGRPIPWYLNIPLLSWLMLRGRCRFCGARISFRYFAVELITGLWAVLSLARFGPSVSALFCFGFGAALLAGSVIDLYHRLLPDVVTLGLAGFGLLAALLGGRWISGWPVSLGEAAAGAVMGSGFFYLVAVAFEKFTGKEGMGLGDVKLMAGLGAFLGYQALPAVIFFGAAGGVVVWIWLKALGRADRDFQIPFGPFLSGAACLVMLFRPWLEKNWIIIEWTPPGWPW